MKKYVWFIGGIATIAVFGYWVPRLLSAQDDVLVIGGVGVVIVGGLVAVKLIAMIANHVKKAIEKEQNNVERGDE